MYNNIITLWICFSQYFFLLWIMIFLSWKKHKFFIFETKTFEWMKWIFELNICYILCFHLLTTVKQQTCGLFHFRIPARIYHFVRINASVKITLSSNLRNAYKVKLNNFTSHLNLFVWLKMVRFYFICIFLFNMFRYCICDNLSLSVFYNLCQSTILQTSLSIPYCLPTDLNCFLNLMCS